MDIKKSKEVHRMLQLIPAVKTLQLCEGNLTKKAIYFDGAVTDCRLTKALAALPTAADGAVLTMTVTIPADSLGYMTLTDLNRNTAAYVTYRVIRNGTDVTGQYPVVFTLPEGMEDTPILTVKARSLELTAASETRVDDGTPLTNATVYVTKGTLAPGHTLTATAEGTQTGAGTSENTVGDVTILDQNGKDVTSLYTIRKIKGTLTLLAEA
jgi:hypothetical protein